MSDRGRRLLVACALALALGAPSTGCGGDSSVICDKVYETCSGALVDGQGISISRESCIRLFDDLAAENGTVVNQIASCVEKAECDALAPCFAGSGAAP